MTHIFFVTGSCFTSAAVFFDFFSPNTSPTMGVELWTIRPEEEGEGAEGFVCDLLRTCFLDFSWGWGGGGGGGGGGRRIFLFVWSFCCFLGFGSAKEVIVLVYFMVLVQSCYLPGHGGTTRSTFSFNFKPRPIFSATLTFSDWERLVWERDPLMASRGGGGEGGGEGEDTTPSSSLSDELSSSLELPLELLLSLLLGLAAGAGGGRGGGEEWGRMIFT